MTSADPQHTTAIIQARMTSTRLPGKILKPVCDMPLLAIQIDRLQQSERLKHLVVATTTNATDDPVVELCEHLAIPVVRGPEDDVLGRYQLAMEATPKADPVVRITADCPLIDAAVVDKVIDSYLRNKCDYASNALQRSYPRGLDVEVMSRQALLTSADNATLTHQREHVTPFIHQQPERFALIDVLNDTDQSHHRWTVDTPEDFELVSRILDTLYPENPYFTMADVLSLLDKHSDWVALNAHIEQKKLSESTANAG